MPSARRALRQFEARNDTLRNENLPQAVTALLLQLDCCIDLFAADDPKLDEGIADPQVRLAVIQTARLPADVDVRQRSET